LNQQQTESNIIIEAGVRQGGFTMGINWDMLKGKWGELRGEARQQWGKLTDDDWEQVKGHQEKLIGKLQYLYGWSREEAERRVQAFFSKKQ
jgi:uncharacterized protein YjbJ (UPF0337 family)